MASIHDPETWSEWGNIDEEFATMMENNVPRRFLPVNLPNLANMREDWAVKCTADTVALMEGTNGAVVEEVVFIPIRNGSTARCLVFKPRGNPTEGMPLVLLIHGGGFLFGLAEMEAATCIRLVQAFGCIAVSLDYKLAPETKFPVAYEDCWDALQWIAGNVSTLGADLSKGFVLGGTSSGGQLAAALSHQARDEELSPPLTGVYLNATSIVHPEAIPAKYRPWHTSLRQNEGKAGLSQKTQNLFFEAVRPDIESDLWNPLNWSTGHENLPPTYFQACGADIQRDDSLVYERVLRLEYAVETRIDIYPGLPHVFWYMYPGHSACDKFYLDAVRGIGWLLEARRDESHPMSSGSLVTSN
ncbi:alpha/beta-hydrolase [Thozetella sp. PMI_491]|nr:alpha/beta-hydrolase [Thozetella sp. PMI_491]